MIVLPALGAFLAFSLAESATYIVNDLWDLETDRQHPRKTAPFCQRPYPDHIQPCRALVLLVTALCLTSATSFLLFLVL